MTRSHNQERNHLILFAFDSIHRSLLGELQLIVG